MSRPTAPASARTRAWATSTSADRASSSEAETAASEVAPADTFVGRRQLIEELTGMPPIGDARFASTSGIAGMGKTWLVKRLQRDAAEWPGKAFELSLQYDDTKSPTTAMQAWGAFVDVLRKHGARLLGRNAPAFANALDAVEQKRTIESIKNEVDARDADVGPGGSVGNMKIDDSVVEALLDPKVREASKAFLRAFAPLAKRRPTLVTIDGFDTIASSPLAGWLISLLAQLPNTLVVIMRSPGAVSPSVATEQRTLDPFSPEEVGELMTCFLPGRTIDPELVKVVHKWSEGHVFSATLAAKYLQTLDEIDPKAVKARLVPAALPAEMAAKRAKIALEIVRAPGTDDLDDAVRTLSVARRFDEDLLHKLCVEPPAPKDAIRRLQDMGIVEQDDDGSYRVHSFLREPLEALLSPTRRRELHRVGAAHYYDLLCKEEPAMETSARAYDAWYRYERPEWQARLREWLYHSRGAAETDEEKEGARLRFTRVFLDAFWWWGCYLPFPFSRDLIADWRRARGDDAEWVQDLEVLLDTYPTGYRKHGLGRWEDVRAALIAVRAACGLDVAADAIGDHEARHTRGLIDNFLAHSYRYAAATDGAQRAKLYRQALAKYDEAARLFEQGDETWERAWTLFERAELHVDNRAIDDARGEWDIVVELALEEEDWELTANLHRLVADIRWLEGSTASAFDAHGRAVLHAYLFQRKTASLRPDAYTVTFYFEQLERVFERLESLAPAGLEDAASRLAAPFGATPPPADAVAAVLAAGDPRRLAGLVFPEAPKENELLEVSSPFTARVDLLAEDLAPERDLEGVAP